ncbi:hypothetical protein CNMCM8927_002943 [Aspergillus lentulus]|uniref:Uncharacterized protein n=1 Tax=Aspergillus lentulus TaxID=293939 RepID=A0AAN5YFQ7_ASPLE|nr:hypothetical protein CNMCM8927_002943 [Aspergillus lentulus]
MNQLSLPAGPARSIYPCTYPPATSLSSTNRNPNFSYSGLPTGDADRYVSSPTSSALSNPHRSNLDASPRPAYSGLVPSISRSKHGVVMLIACMRMRMFQVDILGGGLNWELPHGKRDDGPIC